jgi:hypothetical protein
LSRPGGYCRGNWRSLERQGGPDHARLPSQAGRAPWGAPGGVLGGVGCSGAKQGARAACHPVVDRAVDARDCHDPPMDRRGIRATSGQSLRLARPFCGQRRLIPTPEIASAPRTTGRACPPRCRIQRLTGGRRGLAKLTWLLLMVRSIDGWRLRGKGRRPWTKREGWSPNLSNIQGEPFNQRSDGVGALRAFHDRWTAPARAAGWFAPVVLTGQCLKPITQHGYSKTAAPRIDPAQDLVARPNEKSAAENYFASHTYLIRWMPRPNQGARHDHNP